MSSLGLTTQDCRIITGGSYRTSNNKKSLFLPNLAGFFSRQAGRILGHPSVLFFSKFGRKINLARNPGKKKFLPGYFVHPAGLPREKRSCLIHKDTVFGF